MEENLLIEYSKDFGLFSIWFSLKVFLLFSLILIGYGLYKKRETLRKVLKSILRVASNSLQFIFAVLLFIFLSIEVFPFYLILLFAFLMVQVPGILVGYFFNEEIGVFIATVMTISFWLNNWYIVSYKKQLLIFKNYFTKKKFPYKLRLVVAL